VAILHLATVKALDEISDLLDPDPKNLGHSIPALLVLRVYVRLEIWLF